MDRGAIVSGGFSFGDFAYPELTLINTFTTLVTFLMVFLIQNTQNRDAKAIHLKLDELIRAVRGARNTLVDLEELTDDELAEPGKQFHRLHESARGRATGKALGAVESGPSEQGEREREAQTR